MEYESLALRKTSGRVGQKNVVRAETFGDLWKSTGTPIMRYRIANGVA